MEAEPRLDASAPSGLRLAAFVLTAVGALVIGVGSLLTWVTVGIADATGIQTVSPGTDLVVGLVTLVGAVVILALVVMSRLVADRARRVLAGVVILLGSLTALLAAVFVKVAPEYYSPVDDQALIAAIANATGKTVEQVRAALTQVIDEVGGYTHVGPGPWVVIIGGVLVIVGGILTLRWARAIAGHDTDAGAGAPTPTTEPLAEA
jgi:hypothetical protein